MIGRLESFCECDFQTTLQTTGRNFLQKFKVTDFQLGKLKISQSGQSSKKWISKPYVAYELVDALQAWTQVARCRTTLVKLATLKFKISDMSNLLFPEDSEQFFEMIFGYTQRKKLSLLTKTKLIPALPQK